LVGTVASLASQTVETFGTVRSLACSAGNRFNAARNPFGEGANGASVAVVEELDISDMVGYYTAPCRRTPEIIAVMTKHGVPGNIFRRFLTENMMQTSAALAFTTLMALVPLGHISVVGSRCGSLPRLVDFAP
jgi:hypothetical protein